jgi:hypothetical protein
MEWQRRTSDNSSMNKNALRWLGLGLSVLRYSKNGEHPEKYGKTDIVPVLLVQMKQKYCIAGGTHLKLTENLDERII